MIRERLSLDSVHTFTIFAGMLPVTHNRFAALLTGSIVCLMLLVHPCFHASGLMLQGIHHSAPVATLCSHVHADAGDTAGQAESFCIPEPVTFAAPSGPETRPDCPPAVPIAFWQPPE